MGPRRFSRNPDALWRVEHDGGGDVAALIYLDNDIVTVNGVGLHLWRLCDGATVEDLVDRLMDEYDVDRSTLTDDVLRFIGEMEERRLIIDAC